MGDIALKRNLSIGFKIVKTENRVSFLQAFSFELINDLMTYFALSFELMNNAYTL